MKLLFDNIRFDLLSTIMHICCTRTDRAVSLGNQFGAGSGPTWLDDVACLGTETHVMQCGHHVWGIHNCGHSEDVSIRCG